MVRERTSPADSETEAQRRHASRGEGVAVTGAEMFGVQDEGDLLVGVLRREAADEV